MLKRKKRRQISPVQGATAPWSLGRKLLFYLCKSSQKGKVSCIQGHHFDGPCSIKRLVVWGLDTTGGPFFTWNQSMLKKCYGGGTSTLCENINLKLMCTATWLEGTDRWSDGQWPKWSKFYLFFFFLYFFFLFINLENWLHSLSKIILFTGKQKKIYMLQNTILIHISETPLPPLLLNTVNISWYVYMQR